jgi:hypothetical protein
MVIAMKQDFTDSIALGKFDSLVQKDPFAALSYAVTSSFRGGEKVPKKETTDLLASQLMQFVTSVENAVVRLKTANACSDAHPSF